jgi:hypothetical protein
MSTAKPELFNVLVYIMFVGIHHLDKDVHGWATQGVFQLTTEKIRQTIPHLHAYIQGKVDGRTFQMKHELLSLALFHVCSNDRRYLPALLTHCQFPMLEELLRPASTVIWNDFSFILGESEFNTLITRIAKENLYVNMIDHPLMGNTQFHTKLQNSCPPKVWTRLFQKS